MNKTDKKYKQKTNSHNTKPQHSFRRAVYPGSFDPITMGHVDIIQRISHMFDELIVLVSVSSQKQSLFTSEERMNMIKKSFQNNPKIKVDKYDGLTVDYVKKNNAQVIVRGLRAVVDFEYEMTMASMNKKIAPKIETMLVFASPEYYYISSRGVKEVASHRGSLKGLVPKHVVSPLNKKLNK